ncbi:hypothetical protein HK405_003631 [Cladochytrium tenue]|nr:hypothetical protein HK405_003631 [Cladochytrium tenue]
MVLEKPTDYTRWVTSIYGHLAKSHATPTHRMKAAGRIPGVPGLALAPGQALPQPLSRNQFHHRPVDIDPEDIMEITAFHVPDNPEYIGFWTYSNEQNLFPGTRDDNMAGVAHIMQHTDDKYQPEIQNDSFVFLALQHLQNAVGKIDLAQGRLILHAFQTITIEDREQMDKFEPRFKSALNELREAIKTCPDELKPQIRPYLDFDGQLTVLNSALRMNNFWNNHIIDYNRAIKTGEIAKDIPTLFRTLREWEQLKDRFNQPGSLPPTNPTLTNETALAASDSRILALQYQWEKSYVDATVAEVMDILLATAQPQNLLSFQTVLANRMNQ